MATRWLRNAMPGERRLVDRLQVVDLTWGNAPLFQTVEAVSNQRQIKLPDAIVAAKRLGQRRHAADPRQCFAQSLRSHGVDGSSAVRIALSRSGSRVANAQ